MFDPFCNFSTFKLIFSILAMGHSINMGETYQTGTNIHGKIISIAPMLDVTYREFR